MKNCLYSILFLLFLVSQNIYSGWARSYGNVFDDWGYSVCQTQDGGFAAVGETQPSGALSGDILLLKTDSNGDSLWSKTYGGDYEDWPFSIQETSDGGFIICGYTKSYGSGSKDVYLIKTDNNGDTLWTRTYGGEYEDWGLYTIEIQGGYMIVGSTKSFSSGASWDAYVIKTDQNGDTVWTKFYGGANDQWAHHLLQISSDSFVFCGKMDYPERTAAYIISFDSMGDPYWTKIYGDLYTFINAFSLDRTSDGFLIFTGMIWSHSNPNCVMLMKTDRFGDTLWIERYYGYEGRSILETSDNSYMITGTTWSGALRKNVLLMKTDTSGAFIWTRTFGSISDEEGQCVKRTNDGGFIIAGSAQNSQTGYWDIYLVKTDPQGVGVEEQTINTGESIFSPSVVFINGKIFLSFYLVESDEIKLEVFDLTGRLLFKPFSEFFSQGSNIIEIEVEKPGVFFFALESDISRETGKFTVY